jgi:hypothetical protein
LGKVNETPLLKKKTRGLGNGSSSTVFVYKNNFRI